jgi:hypothetical protein
MRRPPSLVGCAPLLLLAGLAACNSGSSCNATTGGIGNACNVSDDCPAGKTLTCPPGVTTGGRRICTRYCDYSNPNTTECGDGARCVYVGAGGWCVPTACTGDFAQPVPISHDTTVGRVNPEGVGQPCSTFRDCTGTLAKTCARGMKFGGFDFCTTDCDYSVNDNVTQCGAGAVCVYVGGGYGRCVPQQDAARLAQTPPPVPDVANPCCAGPGDNEQGVGVICKTHADCANNHGANVCPIALNPNRPDLQLPNWCTHLCDFGDDASCGTGAICWWRSSGEGGLVGSCVRTACLRANNPPACPP